MLNAGDYDLAIIGGGPAGCSAAIRATQLGLRAIVFEARSYPHDKLCGEFLSPECAAMLTALGAWPRLRKLSPHPIETARLTAPDGFTWQTRWPQTAWGLTRKALDAALAERAQEAGAVVQTGATVVDLQGDLRTGFRLEVRSAAGRQSVSARSVIAAYGKRAALDRRLGRAFLQRPQPFVAFKAHFHHLDLPGQIELHAFPGGYCGISHFEPSEAEGPAPANVCFLAHQSVFHQAQHAGKKPLPAFLDWMVRQNPHLQARLAVELSADMVADASHDASAGDAGQPQDGRWLSIAAVPFSAKSPLEGDLLMAGDAAGLIVPLAGDGIAMALHSGMLAAACATAYLQGDCSAAELRQQYQRRWQQAFGSRLALGRLLQAVMLRPRLISAGLRMLSLFPALGHYVVTHTRELNEFNPYDPSDHIPGHRGTGESLPPGRDL